MNSINRLTTVINRVFGCYRATFSDDAGLQAIKKLSVEDHLTVIHLIDQK